MEWGYSGDARYGSPAGTRGGKWEVMVRQLMEVGERGSLVVQSSPQLLFPSREISGGRRPPGELLHN